MLRRTQNGQQPLRLIGEGLLGTMGFPNMVVNAVLNR
jgi:hypothetical protein